MLVNEQQAASHDESAILHPSSRALFRFWEAMRAERAAPRRAELDLKQIRPLVPNLLIADSGVSGMAYRWRLAGTGICELYRRELTGQNMMSGWDGFEIGVMSRFLDGVVRNHQPCLLRFRFRTNLDQIIGAELIGLPILASDGRTIHVFGGVFPFREIASLAYDRIESMELSGARSIWTEHLPGDHLLSQAAHSAETHVSRPFRAFQVIDGGRHGI